MKAGVLQLLCTPLKRLSIARPTMGTLFQESGRREGGKESTGGEIGLGSTLCVVAVVSGVLQCPFNFMGFFINPSMAPCPLSSVAAINITTVLDQYPSFSTFNSYLSQTHLAEEINARQPPFTILVVDNSNIAPLSSMSAEMLKKTMSVHVILNYFDANKLHNLQGKSELATTLFQTTGNAAGNQGFLNITDFSDQEVGFLSLANGPALRSTMVKPVETRPYDLSVLQISNVIIPFDMANPGNSSTSPSSSPVQTSSPTKSPVSTPAKSPVSPVSSPAKSPVSSPAKAPVSSPAKSPAKSPVSSPAKSPVSSPAVSSPAKTPVSSPARTPVSSPANAPGASPASAPGASPSNAPGASSISSPAQSPSNAPGASSISSPEQGPSSDPDASSISSPAQSPRKMLSPLSSPSPSETDTKPSTPDSSSSTEESTDSSFGTALGVSAGVIAATLSSNLFLVLMA
nr:fasciclin-like arabinogalactan protein 14 [Ipomoea batatas]